MKLEKPDDAVGEKLKLLASRLGVPPLVSPNSSLIYRCASGEVFDIFDVISAFMDRLDAAERKM